MSFLQKDKPNAREARLHPSEGVPLLRFRFAKQFCFLTVTKEHQECKDMWLRRGRIHIDSITMWPRRLREHIYTVSMCTRNRRGHILCKRISFRQSLKESLR